MARSRNARPAAPSRLPTPALAELFAAVRARSAAIAKPLSAEDCVVQSMPDASPVKGHLAPTPGVFETFILERYEPAFKPFNAQFRILFNSYYNAVGDKHPRPERGMLTRPALDEVLAYRSNVDARLRDLLHSKAGTHAAIADLAENQEVTVVGVGTFRFLCELLPGGDESGLTIIELGSRL